MAVRRVSSSGVGEFSSSEEISSFNKDGSGSCSENASFAYLNLQTPFAQLVSE